VNNEQAEKGFQPRMCKGMRWCCQQGCGVGGEMSESDTNSDLSKISDALA